MQITNSRHYKNYIFKGKNTDKHILRRRLQCLAETFPKLQILPKNLLELNKNAIKNMHFKVKSIQKHQTHIKSLPLNVFFRQNICYYYKIMYICN